MSDTRQFAHDALRVPGAGHRPALRQIKGAPLPTQLNEENGGKTPDIHVSGKLTKGDFEHFVPEFERLVRQHGKLRVLFDRTVFHGWEEDMTAFCEPFTRAAIRYFDHSHADEARSWLARGGDR